jgi:hypothetical protein
MKTKGLVLLLAAALLLLPCAASAAALDKGSVEVEGSAGFEHSGYTSSGTSVGTVTRIDGEVGGAYSLSRLVQLGGGLLLSHYSESPEGEASFTSTGYGASADVTLNFKTPSGLIPFVRAGLGFENFTGDGYEDAKTATLAPMLRAGVRFLVGDSGSINLSLAYRHETNANGSKDLDANRFGIAVGLSLFPVRGK